MSNMWERVIKNFKQGATASAEKIEFYAKLGKIKIDVISVKRKMDALFSELGGEAFTYIAKHQSSELAKELKVKDLIRQIKDQEDELKAMETKIAELKERTPDIEMRRSDDITGDAASENTKQSKPVSKRKKKSS